MREVEVVVTQHDILYGGGHIYNCPLALAISRAEGREFCVGTESFWLRNRPRLYASLPEPMRSFRRAYDTEGRSAVKPLAVTLQIPEAL